MDNQQQEIQGRMDNVFKTFPITVDLIEKTDNEVNTVLQNDMNSIKFIFNITNGGTLIDLSNTRVQLVTMNREGVSNLKDCTIEEGECSIVLDTSMYGVVGLYQANLIIYQDDRVVESRSFNYLSNKSILNDETIDSDNKYQAINKAIFELQLMQIQLNKQQEQLLIFVNGGDVDIPSTGGSSEEYQTILGEITALKELVNNDIENLKSNYYTKAQVMELIPDYTSQFNELVELNKLVSESQLATKLDVPTGDGSKYLSDDGTYKVIEQSIKSSSFMLHVNGEETNWNSNDSNTCYFPKLSKVWEDIPGEFSKLTNAHNAEQVNFYASLAEDRRGVQLTSDISEKVDTIAIQLIALMQNVAWYNTCLRLIAYAPGTPNEMIYGDALQFDDSKCTLLLEQDFSAGATMRNGSNAARDLHTKLKNNETGEILTKNNWILKFQIWTEYPNQDYVSDKSIVVITFNHK